MWSDGRWGATASDTQAIRALPYATARDCRVRLLCVPYAGAGASVYLPWRSRLPEWVGLCPLQLPGRETRVHEALVHDVGSLVDDILGQIAPVLDRPFALLGHSMGALVAFELARALRRDGAPPPVHLLVAGRAAPQMRSTHTPLHDLPLHRLLDHLRELGGAPRAMLDEPGLLEPFLPVLRADCAVNETYHYRREPPLRVPLTVVGGLTDGRATVTELVAWQEQTSERFELRLVPGGHFSMLREPATLIDSVVTALSGWRVPAENDHPRPR